MYQKWDITKTPLRNCNGVFLFKGIRFIFLCGLSYTLLVFFERGEEVLFYFLAKINGRNYFNGVEVL